MTTAFKPGDRAVVSDRPQGGAIDSRRLRIGSVVTVIGVDHPARGYAQVDEGFGEVSNLYLSALDPIEPPLGLPLAVASASPEMVTSLLYALATATGQTPKTVALAHGIGADFLMERDR